MMMYVGKCDNYGHVRKEVNTTGILLRAPGISRGVTRKSERKVFDQMYSLV